MISTNRTNQSNNNPEESVSFNPDNFLSWQPAGSKKSFKDTESLLVAILNKIDDEHFPDKYWWEIHQIQALRDHDGSLKLTCNETGEDWNEWEYVSWFMPLDDLIAIIPEQGLTGK